jgi:acyl phosphate:glycerol-3-phosphate acyltransferase
VDLREHGSRNIGATNAFRVLGARWGVIVFALDLLKGLLAVFASRFLATSLPGAPDGVLPSLLLPLALVAGVAAILGHVFTPWLGFRGGRGVATSLGVFLGIVPLPTLVAFALWSAVFALSRRVSVGSIVAALAYPFLVFLLTSGAARALVTVVAAAVAALVLVRHIPNIRRLLSGTEPPTVRASKEGRS